MNEWIEDRKNLVNIRKATIGITVYRLSVPKNSRRNLNCRNVPEKCVIGMYVLLTFTVIIIIYYWHYYVYNATINTNFLLCTFRS